MVLRGIPSGSAGTETLSSRRSLPTALSRTPLLSDNWNMHAVLIAAAIGCVSLLYAMAGQAGGTAFLAIMAFAAFPAVEMRATALMLNIVAAGYATWQLHRRAATDVKMLVPLIVPSLFTAFAGGLIALNGPMYFTLTGLLLIAAGTLMVLSNQYSLFRLWLTGQQLDSSQV